MRWVGEFFRSGRFVPWALGLSILVLFALPSTVFRFLLYNAFIVGAGALAGWTFIKFLQDIRKWGLRRSLRGYVFVPLVIALSFTMAILLVSALSWLFGDAYAFVETWEDGEALVGFVYWLAQEPRAWAGAAIGVGIHFVAGRIRRRLERSPDYVAEKRLLRYILWYQLKIWSAWPTSTSPFHHEWPVPPGGDTSPLSEDQMDAYMDLRGQRRSVWQRIKRLFRRR